MPRANRRNRKVFHLEIAVKTATSMTFPLMIKARVRRRTLRGNQGESASPRKLNVVPPAAWPRRTHGGQSDFLEVVVNPAHVAVVVLGNNIADLAEAGGGRNADIFAQV